MYLALWFGTWWSSLSEVILHSQRTGYRMDGKAWGQVWCSPGELNDHMSGGHTEWHLSPWGIIAPPSPRLRSMLISLLRGISCLKSRLTLTKLTRLMNKIRMPVYCSTMRNLSWRWHTEFLQGNLHWKSNYNHKFAWLAQYEKREI